MSNDNIEVKEFSEIRIRLDAIVVILLKLAYSDENGRIKISEAAPVLHMAGYSPTEIAKMFGKKSSSQVSPFLYSKKKR